jgi:hypothetical protein
LRDDLPPVHVLSMLNAVKYIEERLIVRPSKQEPTPAGMLNLFLDEVDFIIFFFLSVGLDFWNLFSIPLLFNSN